MSINDNVRLLIKLPDMKWIPLFLCMLLTQITQAKSSVFAFDYYNGEFESAKQKAGSEGKLFFVDFYATWCAPCKWMEETAFMDVEVKGLLKENYISVKVDIDDLDGYGIKEMYQVRILPTMLIFNSKGEMIARVEETLSPRKLAKLLSHHNTEGNKVRSRQSVNSSPKQTTKGAKSFTPSPIKKKARTSIKPANQKYRIQLGVFKEFENTYDMVNDLKSKFLEPVIVINDISDGGNLYKVMMGAFSTLEEAEDYNVILGEDFKLSGIVR